MLKWLKIGVVGKPHGLRGAFFVFDRQDAIPRDYIEIILGEDPNAGRRTKLLSSAMSQGHPVITCDASVSRNDSESLRGTPIWVSANVVKVDDSSEYLWADLVGRSVFDVSEVLLGSVVRIVNYGSADTVVVKEAEKGELEIPLVPSFFSMDFKGGEDRLNLIVSSETFSGLWSSEAKCK